MLNALLVEASDVAAHRNFDCVVSLSVSVPVDSGAAA